MQIGVRGDSLDVRRAGDVLLAPGLVGRDDWSELGPFALAISGGRDSMLLLHAFVDLRERGLFGRDFVVFHLDHRLREDSGADLDFVAAESHRLDVSFYCTSRDVRVFARRSRIGSLEAAGRTLRYRSLRRLCERRFGGTGIVVTAHHADDYLESVLVHWIRGGGRAALGTLPVMDRGPEGLTLLRPLLALSRADVSEIVARLGIAFRDDPSNESPEFLRNRLRSGVIPALRQEGLDAVKLWRNFHDAPGGSAGFVGTPTKGGGAGPVEVLCLDRRLLVGTLTELKAVLDVALRRLGLPPSERALLAELRSQQAHDAAAFRQVFESKSLRIWSDRRGPVWLFRQDADVFRAPRFERAGKILRIHWNGRTREYAATAGQRPGGFEPGMRAPLPGGGHLLVKKIFQDAGVPGPLRPLIPLLIDEDSGLVSCICLSFWEHGKDRHFFSP